MEKFIDVFGLKKSKKLPDDELYVMLMLQRSEGSDAGVDCDDPVVALACSLDTDECPAACKEGSKEDDNKVVKSGDLEVTATAATERKAILDGGVSDLDTITLKASEKITVNSITLERFGYSTVNDVDAIWLEDGDGNKIADEKSLSSSKDTVTLKIKKEYRDMDASNAITVVLRTAKFDNTTCYDAACKNKAGSTIGFKVTGVDASAKNLDISDYKPYTYDLTTYDGSKVSLSVKGNDKTYNYEEGEFYEVSRLKVQAGNSILALNGITLTNNGSVVVEHDPALVGDCPAKEGYSVKQNAAKTVCTYSAATVDLNEFVSDVKVTVDGKEVKGLKYNVTKDNEIVLNWDTVEVEINKNVQLVVSIAMENLDKFGNVVRLVLADKGDLNATEKKTGARVTVDAPAKNANSYKTYIFNGSKIKFSNTKLSSTIDAAQGAEDVVIAKGKVTLGEEVKVYELVFQADKENIIDAMSLTVAGETYDASVVNDTTNHKATFTFKNVIMEKSGDFELSIDVADKDEVTGESVSITYGTTSTSIGKAVFAGDNKARYETSREDVKEADVSGSISISKLKVQESKATLKNGNSKNVEFVKDETSDRTTVFKGTYTAKKSDLTLKEFAIVYPHNDATYTLPGDANDATTAEFYLYVNGEEVGSIDETEIKTLNGVDATHPFDSYENLSEDVELAAGKSVDIEVKAVITPTDKSASNINLDLYLRGQDKNGTNAGVANAGLTTFKFVLNGSLTISDSTTLAKKTVVLQENEITVAKFTLKPSKSDSVKLDNLVFDFSDIISKGKKEGNVALTVNDITVTVDGTDLDVLAPSAGKYWDEKGDEVTTAPAKTYTKYDATDVDDITDEIEVEVKVTGLIPAAKTTGQKYTKTDAVSLTLASVNGVAKNSTYTRLVLPAIVKVDSQRSDGAVTFFRVNTEDYDGGQIQNMKFYSANVAGEGEAGIVGNESEVEVSNQATSEVVTKVTFDIVKDAATYSVELENGDFSDYFKTTDGTTLRVSKVSDK